MVKRERVPGRTSSFGGKMFRICFHFTMFNRLTFKIHKFIYYWFDHVLRILIGPEHGASTVNDYLRMRSNHTHFRSASGSFIVDAPLLSKKINPLL